MTFEPVIDSHNFTLMVPEAAKDKLCVGIRSFNIDAVLVHAGKSGNAAGEVTSRQVVVNFAIGHSGDEKFSSGFTVSLFMMAGDALDLARKLSEAVEQSNEI